MANNNAQQLSEKEKYYKENLNFLQDVKKTGLMGSGFIQKIILFIPSIILIIKNIFRNKAIKADEFDKRVMTRASEAKRRVFEMIGVDKAEVSEAKPIVAVSYDRCEDIYGNWSFIKRGDKDGKIRSSDYNVAMYLFSTEEVFVYNYNFSMIKDSINESCEEYFYKDIVTLSVVQRKDMLELGVSEKKGLFGKTATNSVKVPISFNSFALVTTSGRSTASAFSGSDTIVSLNAMRQLIRDKKRQ